MNDTGEMSRAELEEKLREYGYEETSHGETGAVWMHLENGSRQRQ